MLNRQLADLIKENTIEKEIPSEFFKYLETVRKEDPKLNDTKLGELPDKFLKDSLDRLAQDISKLKNLKGDSDTNVQKLLDLQIKFNFVLQKKPKAPVVEIKVDQPAPARVADAEPKPSRYVIRDKKDEKEPAENPDNLPDPARTIASDLRKLGQSGLTPDEGGFEKTRSRYAKRAIGRGVTGRLVELKLDAALPEDPKEVCCGTRTNAEGMKYASVCIPASVLEQFGMDTKDPDTTNKLNAMLAADAKFEGKEITRNVEWKKETKGDAIYFIADFVLTGDKVNDDIQKGRAYEYSQKVSDELQDLRAQMGRGGRYR